MIGFFVSSEAKAEELSRLLDPSAFTVRCVGRMAADRFDSIIVSMPDQTLSAHETIEMTRWLEWLPTRLATGCEGRIFFL